MILHSVAKVIAKNHQEKNKTARQDYFPVGQYRRKKSVRSLFGYQIHLKVEFVVDGFVAQTVEK